GLSNGRCPPDANYLISLPPFDEQSEAEAMTKPWPLHEFMPLQALLADLQELWPLQELMPEHLMSAALAPVTATTLNSAAAAVATTIPELFFIDIWLLP